MELRLLSVAEVTALHEAVLNAGELEGLAPGASLEGALARVELRAQYGMSQDVYDLAAMYAVALARAHAFRDGNKRTAHATMEFVLLTHEIHIPFDTKTVGDMIIRVAAGKLDEVELAQWLRQQAQQ